MKLRVPLLVAAFLPLLSACFAHGTEGGVVPFSATPLSVADGGGKMRITGRYVVAFMSSPGIDDLVVGPDGRIWFTEFGGSAFGAITTAGTLSSYSISSSYQLNGIAVGPKRKTIWAGGYGGTMVASSLTGAFATHPVPGAHIGDVVVGPDKQVWFNDYGNNKIGRITATGTVTEFSLPPGFSPDSMAVGKDKHFWILASNGHKNEVLIMSTSGAILGTYSKGISKKLYLSYIAAAPDGNLYFTEYADSLTANDRIARITTKGVITQIGSVPPLSSPERLTVGKDGNVYFSMAYLQAIGKITLASGKVTYTYLPFTNGAGTNALVNGPDNRLYAGAGYVVYAISY